MRIFNWLLSLIVLNPFVLVSCSRTEAETRNGSDEYGTVEFQCNARREIKYIATRADGQTKVLPENVIPPIESLSLDISNSEGFSSHYDVFSEYDQPYLASDEYSAKFVYGDPEMEGPDAAYFETVHPFKVIARKTSTENVSVPLANSVYSVIFSQWFSDYYQEYNINIETEAGYSVAYKSGDNPAGTESSPVFIKAGSGLYLSGNATKTNGVEVSFPRTQIAVTKAGTWQTININASQASAGAIEIVLDDSVLEIREISVELNPDA